MDEEGCNHYHHHLLLLLLFLRRCPFLMHPPTQAPIPYISVRRALEGGSITQKMGAGHAKRGEGDASVQKWLARVRRESAFSGIIFFSPMGYCCFSNRLLIRKKAEKTAYASRHMQFFQDYIRMHPVLLSRLLHECHTLALTAPPR